MEQDTSFALYVSDIRAMPTLPLLEELARRWEREWSGHLRAQELREVYRKRMEELRG
jgi:hypothetical protein